MPDSLRGARVIVTGGAGFIGANLVARLLEEGADVHVLVRRTTDRSRLGAIDGRFAVEVADLTDAPSVRLAVRDVSPEIVFHAAVAGGHPVSADARLAAVADTVLGTAVLCEALRATPPRRFVHLGSWLEYGPASEPLLETRVPAPRTFRGATKAACTELCLQFARESGIATVVLRPFSVYGPRESDSRFIPALMRALIAGEPLRLTPPGVCRDFVYVGDVVDACLRAATAREGPGEIINIGSGRQWTNEAVVEAAERISGRRVRSLPGTFERRPVDVEFCVADIQKARRLLGWQPGHPLERGLRATYEWFAAREAAAASAARRGTA